MQRSGAIDHKRFSPVETLHCLVESAKDHTVEAHTHHLHYLEVRDKKHTSICCRCRHLFMVTELEDGKIKNPAEHLSHHWHRESNHNDSVICTYTCCECDAKIQTEHQRVANVFGQLIAARQHPCFEDALSTATKIVSNAIVDTKARDRPIRLSNPRIEASIGSFPLGVMLLEEAGFELVGDFLQLPMGDSFTPQSMRKLVVAKMQLEFEANRWQMMQDLNRGIQIVDDPMMAPLYSVLGVDLALAEKQDTQRFVQYGERLFDPFTPINCNPLDGDNAIMTAAKCLCKVPEYVTQRASFLQCVIFIGMMRNADKMVTFAHSHASVIDQSSSLDKAYAILSVTSDASDESVAVGFQMAIQIPDMIKRVQAIEALREVQSHRKSAVLEKLLTDGVSSSQQQSQQPQSYSPSHSSATSPSRSPTRDTAPTSSSPPRSPGRTSAVSPFIDSVTSSLRSGDSPVGLVNKSNLCYFNSLAQTYFAVPALRSAIIKCVIDAEKGVNHDFVHKLQLLYALMQSTSRSALSSEPAALALLRERKTVSWGQQQDVHEFNDFLLTAIEDVFKSNGDEETYNNLFAGSEVQVLSFPGTDDADQVSTIPFKGPNIIVQVEANGQLEDALDKISQETAVELGGKQAMKRTLFGRLPSVLFFPLQRLTFDQHSQSAVKKFERFDFPTTIYMDRYLHENKEKVDQRVELVKQMDEQRSKLVGEIHSMERFNDSDNSALQLLTATSKLVAHLPHLFDCDEERQQATLDNLRAATKNYQVKLDTMKRERDELQSAIDSVYDDMQESPYELKAVLVHTGGASAGHYFAHIRSDNKWRKYNDANVSEESEADMLREGRGGPQSLMSAYCLIYVAKNDPLMNQQVENQLPEHLQKMIVEDNEEASTLSRNRSKQAYFM